MPVLLRFRAILPNCLAPSTVELLATFDKAGRNHRAFDGENGAHCQVFGDIQVN